MNPLGNWWFSIAIAVVFTAVGWFVVVRIVAPRIGLWHDDGSDVSDGGPRRSLRWSGAACGLRVSPR